MIRLAEVITRFEADLRSRFGHRLRPEQRRALAALTHCRTAASPKFQVRCDACQHQQLIPHSCGHRHCPRCQHHEGQAWIEQQAQRLVPAEYFFVTFTLPAELRALAEAEPYLVYDSLLRCGWETVRTFVGNDRQLRGSAGAIAVLHTHNRRLDYHPHGHFVVPAAAIDEACQHWRTKRGYLFSERALAKVFRGKLLAALRAAGCTVPQDLPTAWVAHCKSVGSGQSALITLGRYLYRGVIREEDILACDEDTVRFRYREAKTGQMQQRVLAGAEFLWLVLQHVLPKGFRRARNYGFLHPNRKRLIALLQLVLKCLPWRDPSPRKPRPAMPCPGCGTPMVIVTTRIPPALAPPHLGSAVLV
jgi:hypothetical protein